VARTGRSTRSRTSSRRLRVAERPPAVRGPRRPCRRAHGRDRGFEPADDARARVGGGRALYGRADACLEVGPLPAGFLRDALDVSRGPGARRGVHGLGRRAALRGTRRGRPGTCRTVRTPRARPAGSVAPGAERLLRGVPSATEVRPVLDVIGGGAHRVTEIAGRLGRPATSLARPLTRLQALGLVRRDIPFGEAERGGRRALYRIADPFTRAWFRVVAPHRAAITSGTRATRRASSPGCGRLCAEASGRPPAGPQSPCGRRGTRARPGPCARWWHGESPEWDAVGVRRRARLLLGR
jgi:hypothetical protein